MRVRSIWWLTILASVVVCAACDVGRMTAARADAGASPDGDPLPGVTELRVTVPDTGRVYVKLATPAMVEPASDPIASTNWDLAFQGYDVYTNSGPSGGGQGSAFGPLDTSAFSDVAAPDVPFLQADEAGGAFLDWYDYEGTAHVLYSRFHVYGVRNEIGTWKVQFLTYYSERSGAPTSALYQIRFADVAGGPATDLQVDGTAGGLQGGDGAPSGCLDLARGAVSMLTVAEAQGSMAWDLCFRRDTVSVNGEAGGPRGAGAIDLQADQTASETIEDVEARTADSERGKFDAVNASTFASAIFRGDHVVSAFERGHWLDPFASRPAPADAAWLVVDASGQRKYLVSFSAFENPTTSSPGTIVMRVKPVSG